MHSTAQLEQRQYCILNLTKASTLSSPAIPQYGVSLSGLQSAWRGEIEIYSSLMLTPPFLQVPTLGFKTDVLISCSLWRDPPSFQQTQCKGTDSKYVKGQIVNISATYIYFLNKSLKMQKPFSGCGLYKITLAWPIIRWPLDIKGLLIQSLYLNTLTLLGLPRELSSSCRTDAEAAPF